MMQQELTEYIGRLLQKTEEQNLKLTDSRDIQYGQQLKFTDGKSKIPVNVYFSRKKGISVVIGGNRTEELYQKLNYLVFKERSITQKQHSWQRWAGTDESGKGDFFGPLVVCGFIMEKRFEKKFIELGIQDSKKLSDEKIRKLAEHLYSGYRRNFYLIELQPNKYNELYTKFEQQGKKLNELLAWMHGRVILNLKERHQFEGAVIDKFAREDTLTNSLQDLKKIDLIQRIKAEDDLAVACSSIIARYNFLKYIEEISKKYDMEFPKGAGKKVVEIAQYFASKLGKDKLKEVAKIHFKTYREI